MAERLTTDIRRSNGGAIMDMRSQVRIGRTDTVRGMRCCPYCGADLPDAARFCPACGRPVPAVQSPEPRYSPLDEREHVRSSRYPLGRRVLAIVPVCCAALIVVGSFGPWATIHLVRRSFSVNGVESDGILALALGAAAGILALVNAGRPTPSLTLAWAMLALFGVVAAQSLWDWSHIERFANVEMTIFGRTIVGDEGIIGDVDVGWGLYLVAVGAVGGLISSASQLWGTAGR